MNTNEQNSLIRTTTVQTDEQIDKLKKFHGPILDSSPSLGKSQLKPWGTT